MSDKSKMELKYERYLLSKDKTLILDGKTFYRIIDKFLVKKMLIITLPLEAFGDNTVEKIITNKYTDEDNRVFAFSAPMHISFIGKAPDWYYETLTVQVKGVKKIDEIGDYISKME